MVTISVTWIKVPQRYQIKFPRNPGPEFDPQVRNFYRDRVDTDQPEIVLLGDSTLQKAVDPDLLSRLTGRRISKFDVPGSASAFWYLVIKNDIIHAKHPPGAVAIIFRDTILTAPGYRVHGRYFIQLDEFAAKQEPTLLDRSYLNLMNPLEKWLEQYFPLYGASGQIRQEIDGWIRYSLPRWLNCDRACTDYSIYQALTSGDLEPGQLQSAVAAAEQYLYTPSQLNFKRQLDRSYLPEIIRLTQEKRIQLILVRLKNETAGRGNTETSAVRRYMDDLAAYLRAQDVPLLDYGTDLRLKSEFFRDTLHLNTEGENVFTQILAEGLNGVLKSVQNTK